MNWNKIIKGLNLATADQEEVIHHNDNSRREFFKIATSASLRKAIASIPFAAALLPTTASAQSNTDIANTLNFALTLEYLEDEFYKTALDSAGLIPDSDKPIFAQISKHESAHVEFLKSALGFAAIQKPTFDFTAKNTYSTVFSDYQTFLTLAQSFEDTGVRAYKGQAVNLKSNDSVLKQALQIHSVEARHAAEIRWLRREVTGLTIKPWIEYNEPNGAPQVIYDGEQSTSQNGVDVSTIASIANLSVGAKSAAFDEPLSKNQILDIVKPFMVS